MYGYSTTADIPDNGLFWVFPALNSLIVWFTTISLVCLGKSRKPNRFRRRAFLRSKMARIDARNGAKAC